MRNLVWIVATASVVLVAWRNLKPKHYLGTLLIVFILGLFHGLLHASSMDYLAVRLVTMEVMSAKFFWGLSIGFGILAVALFTIFFFLRKRKFYQPIILRAGSVAAAAVAVVSLGIFFLRGI